MGVYSQWDFYSGAFGGVLQKADYTAFAGAAAAEIDRQTFGRAKKAPAEMREALQRCECELCEVLYQLRQVPAGVVSMDNDGLRLTYVRQSALRRDGDDVDIGGANLIKQVLRRHLLLPVNLLFCGGSGYAI